MWKKLKFLLTLALLLIASVNFGNTAKASAGSVTLRIHVDNMQGLPLEGKQIHRVYDDDVWKTNSEGYYEFPNLGTGYYCFNLLDDTGTEALCKSEVYIGTNASEHKIFCLDKASWKEGYEIYTLEGATDNLIEMKIVQPSGGFSIHDVYYDTDGTTVLKDDTREYVRDLMCGTKYECAALSPIPEGYELIDGDYASDIFTGPLQLQFRYKKVASTPVVEEENKGDGGTSMPPIDKPVGGFKPMPVEIEFTKNPVVKVVDHYFNADGKETKTVVRVEKKVEAGESYSYTALKPSHYMVVGNDWFSGTATSDVVIDFEYHHDGFVESNDNNSHKESTPSSSAPTTPVQQAPVSRHVTVVGNPLNALGVPITQSFKITVIDNLAGEKKTRSTVQCVAGTPYRYTAVRHEGYTPVGETLKKGFLDRNTVLEFTYIKNK